MTNWDAHPGILFVFGDVYRVASVLKFDTCWIVLGMMISPLTMYNLSKFISRNPDKHVL